MDPKREPNRTKIHCIFFLPTRRTASTGNSTQWHSCTISVVRLRQQTDRAKCVHLWPVMHTSCGSKNICIMYSRNMKMTYMCPQLFNHNVILAAPPLEHVEAQNVTHGHLPLIARVQAQSVKPSSAQCQRFPGGTG